ncbi:hypothetical protein VZT92_012349 [Zoarces viviparus]|uniref:non-specific serine/threonine protein kinase n=1 Tax=Zoarces viviparus TaxID=48416 RepID=A0AAW1F8H4_ZOAVI
MPNQSAEVSEEHKPILPTDDESDNRTTSDTCGLTEVTEKGTEYVEASISEDSESCNTSVDDVGRKRKASDDGPNMKTSSPDQRGLSGSEVVDPTAEFEAKYKQEDLLGKGGCGSVFAGYRKADNLPVAIKHVPSVNILCKHVNGISLEVAIMLKLAAKSDQTSAPISLLEWYNLDQELILVLERPIPAKDLRGHIETNGGPLDEEEAKVILKQLIDAAIDLEKQHIFHRDIKVQNILIETSSNRPRVRLIDFGLSRFVKKRTSYREFFGTQSPPECGDRGVYRPGPTTVFQIGMVLFDMLHLSEFAKDSFFANKQRISYKLSNDCKDLLRTTLNREPKKRPTLKQLKSHPWLT